MKNWKNRDASSRIFYNNSELYKLILRSLLSSYRFDLNDKFFFFFYFQSFNFKSSISFFRNSCLITGSARSVFRLFKLSRNQAKRKASDGFITGLRKSSF